VRVFVFTWRAIREVAKVNIFFFVNIKEEKEKKKAWKKKSHTHFVLLESIITPFSPQKKRFKSIYYHEIVNKIT
jgi:hypothetical protein